MNSTASLIQDSRAIFPIESSSLQASHALRPFGFQHDLHRLELFSMPYIARLAALYEQQAPKDYFIARGAPKANFDFYSVPIYDCPLREALLRIEDNPHRLLFKRLEKHDAGFKALLDGLVKVLRDRDPTLRDEKFARLESSLFVTSSNTITPFHFDPEVNFFFQIRGEKIFHCYEPVVVDESVLDTFYNYNIIDIAPVDLDTCDQGREHVFQLEPGKGLYQPQNAPHWVETNGISISYSFVYETERSRQNGLVHSCNYYLRKLGFQPPRPGQYNTRDLVKANFMKMVRVGRSMLHHFHHDTKFG